MITAFLYVPTVPNKSLNDNISAVEGAIALESVFFISVLLESTNHITLLSDQAHRLFVLHPYAR